MGFSKENYEPEISIEVTHPWHPGDKYIFHLPKTMPQAATDAEATFLGLTDEARPDEHRLHLIATLAEMVTREPEGFDDFPMDNALPAGQHARSLSIRMRDYFDDESKPELESILVGVWRMYRASALPAAHIKSFQNNGARSSDVSALPAKA